MVFMLHFQHICDDVGAKWGKGRTVNLLNYSMPLAELSTLKLVVYVGKI